MQASGPFYFMIHVATEIDGIYSNQCKASMKIHNSPHVEGLKSIRFIITLKFIQLKSALRIFLSDSLSRKILTFALVFDKGGRKVNRKLENVASR